MVGLQNTLWLDCKKGICFVVSTFDFVEILLLKNYLKPLDWFGSTKWIVWKPRQGVSIIDLEFNWLCEWNAWLWNTNTISWIDF